MPNRIHPQQLAKKMQGTKDNLMKMKTPSVPQVLHIRAALDSFHQWLVPWKGLWDLGSKLCLTSVCWRVDLHAFVLSVALKKTLVKLWRIKPWLGRFHTGNEVNRVPSEDNNQNCVLQCWSALTGWFLSSHLTCQFSTANPRTPLSSDTVFGRLWPWGEDSLRSLKSH